ncbi:SGNH/GDSL hydrolase family protein [Streptomonospora litoralis]|uniref:SGNH/GDSL hydrolase family protein n=1 Tax=Streptomonospora litoralis TaxID=2498135 RepID=UPI001F617263|nr:SGNH/GDSL hydrolase family protein [Streptomonospora litoralis]
MASAVLVCVAVMLVPVTREGVLDAWCEVTGQGCSRLEDPRRDYDGASGWRERLTPEEAATWGNYIALGDSYSSGEGAGEYAEGTAASGGCRRSANAYPERVADSFDFSGQLGFFACSRQRGEAMLQSLGETKSQIGRVTAHTSLVTIGIGGNDLGFTTILKKCMLRVPLMETTACSDQEERIERNMRAFDSTFEDIVDEIRERAPDARILVVGYPRLFPTDPEGMYYTLAPHDQEWLNHMLKRFNKQVRQSTAELDAGIVEDRQTGSVEYVRMYDALKGHEIGSEKPWLNGVLLGDFADGVRVDHGTFHPNARGHRAFSEQVLQRLEEGPDRALYAAQETLDNASPEVLAGELD